MSPGSGTLRLLLSLGVKAREVQELTMEGLGGLVESGHVDWLGGWLAGQAALYGMEYDMAVRELRGQRTEVM